MIKSYRNLLFKSKVLNTLRDLESFDDSSNFIGDWHLIGTIKKDLKPIINNISLFEVYRLLNIEKPNYL